MMFSDEHIKIIRATLPGCPEEDFKRFLFNAERLDLDPLLRQIQLIPRKSKDDRGWHTVWETLLGRDSYRILADRTGELDGSESIPTFDDAGKLVSATATVWRKGKSHPFRETVYLSEYQTAYMRDGKEEIGAFWKTKPITMLCKVAEAQVLRKAFPTILTGMYVQEEMEIDRESGEISPPIPPPGNLEEIPFEEKLRRGLEDWIKKAGFDRHAFNRFLMDQGEISSDPAGDLRDLPLERIQVIRQSKNAIQVAFEEWKQREDLLKLVQAAKISTADFLRFLAQDPAYLPPNAGGPLLWRDIKKTSYLLTNWSTILGLYRQFCKETAAPSAPLYESHAEGVQPAATSKPHD